MRAFAKPGCRNEARADEMDHAYETAGFHHAGWRHGRMAARGARAAKSHAGDRLRYGTTVKLNERLLADVRNGLAEYGYVEGQNFRFQFRQANFQNDLLPILFRELVDQKVSVILADSTSDLGLVLRSEAITFNFFAAQSQNAKQ